MATVFARNDEANARPSVTRVTPFAARIDWIIRAFGFNPLIRLTDRLEALAVLTVIATALVAVPVAVQAGQMVYESGVHAAEQQAQSRHPVRALVVEGSGLPTDFETPARVDAQWQQGAETRTERVASPATVKTGDHITIWLDDAGRVVPPPDTVDDAGVSAVATAATIWIALVGCAALLAFVIRKGLDRSRHRAWERDLQLLSNNDDGWANRFT